jgi:hypothetical protein
MIMCLEWPLRVWRRCFSSLTAVQCETVAAGTWSCVTCKIEVSASAQCHGCLSYRDGSTSSSSHRTTGVTESKAGDDAGMDDGLGGMDSADEEMALLQVRRLPQLWLSCCGCCGGRRRRCRVVDVWLMVVVVLLLLLLLTLVLVVLRSAATCCMLCS